MITDEELWEYFAVKNINGIEQEPVFRSKSVKALLNAPIEEKVKYVKKRFRPIIPSEYEFIPRDKWLPLEELIGCSSHILNHPIWETATQFIFDNFIPCSDTCIVQQCSGQKPYIDNHNYVDKTIPLFEAGIVDLFICSTCLIPIEFSIFYPFRYYDWAPSKANDYLTYKLADVKIMNIIRTVNRFNYKRVLLYGPFNDVWCYITEKLQTHYKGTDVEIIQVYDGEMYELIKSTPTRKGTQVPEGILSIRYSDYIAIRHKLQHLVPDKEDREYHFGMSINKTYPQEFYDMNCGMSCYEWEDYKKKYLW